MKLKVFIAVFGLVALFGACSGPRTVTLNSLRPAEITLPASTKTLLILDRTKTEKKPINLIEGVLTGEMPGEDRTGSQELLVALNNQLSRTSRFNTIVAEEFLDGNGITSVFPPPLSRELIDRMATKYQADAIVSLELMDSDFVITRGKVSGNVKSLEQGLKFYAQGIGNITIGIRLYDCRKYAVVDQQLLTNSHTWETTGNSVPEAVAQLASKGDATRYLSNEAGSEYAYKIAPMPIQIRRSFRGKAKRSPELELGTRYADVGQWERAMETWKSGLDRARRKEAGYLAHNIAIAYEVLGEFNQAIQWAEQAYAQYGNDDSRSYVNQIKYRMSSEGLAQMQLDTEE
jgi:tetratricopeptide (TPR) repeat protein